MDDASTPDERDGGGSTDDADPPGNREEDLPPELRELVAPDPQDVVVLYNGLQGMDDEEFRAVFEGSLRRLKEVADADGRELATVLGLSLEAGTVTDATLLSVHESGSDRVVFTNDDGAVPDATVYVPVRPEDFPPGSGEALSDLGVDDYRDVVSAMVFLRHQLHDESPEQLESRYRDPLRRGLRAYADAS